MSTRSNIIVKNNGYGDDIQLYRHCDGYPDGKHGVINSLKLAADFAWKLPRMEADDFSAAIVRAWKDSGGNVYIDGSANIPSSLHGDIEFYYVIEPNDKAGKWKVSVFKYWNETKKKLLWTGHIGDDYTT